MQTGVCEDIDRNARGYCPGEDLGEAEEMNAITPSPSEVVGDGKVLSGEGDVGTVSLETPTPHPEPASVVPVPVETTASTVVVPQPMETLPNTGVDAPTLGGGLLLLSLGVACLRASRRLAR